MCPQTPRLSPEYSHKAGLQTVITGRPLQIRPVTRNGHAGPVTMGQITHGPPFWTRSQDETTSSQVFVWWRMRRRVSLPVVLSPLVHRVRRRPRAKGGVFAFAPTAVNKGLLFPNVGHKCLMAKDDKKKKVHSRDTPKYTTSDDVGSSSDDNDDLTSLFANLTKIKRRK
jgi:hypothetical protein